MNRFVRAILAVAVGSATPLALAACTSAGEDDDDTTPAADDDTSAVDCSDRPLEVPSPRGEVGGVWDEVGGRFVFFGGDEGMPIECSSQTDFVGQTWAFETDCDTFRLLEVEGEHPSARGRHVAALDATRGWMVIQGGRSRVGTSGLYDLHDDTWAFDLSTDTWTLLSDSGGPSPRSNHGGVVSGERLVVYGGSTSADGAVFDPQEDVWALDLDTGTWEELPAGDGPGPRLFHATAVSDDGATMYVYGGGDENAFFGPFFDDLWALDLDTLDWTLLHSGSGAAPAARIWANLLYDGANDRLLMFGGHDDGALGNTNELWSFKLSDGEWNRIREGDVLDQGANGFCDFPADFVVADLDSPERRNASAAALTPSGDLVLFGGKTDCGIINDLWTWSAGGTGWVERSTATAGEICQRAYAECTEMCF